MHEEDVCNCPSCTAGLASPPAPVLHCVNAEELDSMFRDYIDATLAKEAEDSTLEQTRVRGARIKAMQSARLMLHALKESR